MSFIGPCLNISEYIAALSLVRRFPITSPSITISTYLYTDLAFLNLFFNSEGSVGRITVFS